MTRDELLNHLRRELSNQAWSDLRPDRRLSELESNLNGIAERLGELRADYNETTEEELLRALDDLAASLSYLRIEIGHLFSDTTRLTNEIRAALRRADGEDAAEQMAMEIVDDSVAADEAQEQGEESGEDVRQHTLF